MADTKGRIVACAAPCIMKEGISRLSMEELARNCGCGKATLYRHFPSKEALVFAVIDFISGQARAHVEQVTAAKIPAAQKLVALMGGVMRLLSQLRPEALADLCRTMPEAGARIETRRRALILGALTAILEEGKASGDFLPEADSLLLAHIVVGAAGHLMEPGVVLDLGIAPAKLPELVIIALARGFLSPKGRRRAAEFDAAQAPADAAAQEGKNPHA